MDYYFANDQYGINRASYMEQLKLYIKHWEQMMNDRTKLFALLMQYLSPESLDEVKRDPNFNLIKNTRDVRALWEIIETTHKVYTVSKVAAVVKKTARKDKSLKRNGGNNSILCLL